MTEQRERILTCACELYLQGGLEGFSMRKLAKCLGVTAPALYRHFESREQVLLEVVREAYVRLSQHLYRALEGRTPADRFRLAGDAYLEFALTNPRLYDVLYAPPDQMGWERLPPEVEAQVCAVGQFWKDRVRESVDAGILRGRSTDDVAVTLWGHAHGLITLYLRGVLRTDEKGFREIYRSSARRVMAGLGTAEQGALMLKEADGGRPEASGPETADVVHTRYRTGT